MQRLTLGSRNHLGVGCVACCSAESEFLKMDLITAKAALCRLLGVNVDVMPFKDVKILVRKRQLLWHPDKNRDLENPNLYCEQLLELNEAWSVLLESKSDAGSSTQGSFSGHSEEPFNFGSFFRSKPDLYCDESMSESDSEDFQSGQRTPEYNDSPFDDEFFIPSPKKKFTVPDDMRIFFRSLTNRRAGKFLLVFTLASHFEKLKSLKSLYKYQDSTNYYGIWNVRTDKDLCLMLWLLVNDVRLSDVKKDCRKIQIQPLEIFQGTKVAKCIEFAREKYGEPKLEPSKFKGATSAPDSKKINYKLIHDFALEYEISDVYELMYSYSHLATPCDRTGNELTREHENDHVEHGENARIFVHLSDRKRVAKCAIDTVMAKLYMMLKSETNLAYIQRISQDLGHYIQENYSEEQIGEAYYYCFECVPNFFTIAHKIMWTFTEGSPRKRYTILQGDFKSGKTSFASAFCKLFGGININVNVDAGRLPFYLGNAIGKRFVLFDDVKGRYVLSENLQHGQGFANLDNLRDHLDGHVPVQLEKKNQQPIEQVFPPGIITCNNYHIPNSLLQRIIRKFEFTASPNYKYHAPKIITKETIFIGLVLSNLLPVEPHVFEYIYAKKAAWESKHIMNDACKCKKRVSKILFLSVHYGYRNGSSFCGDGRGDRCWSCSLECS